MFTVRVGRECVPVVIAFLRLQPKDISCRLVYGLCDRGRCWTDSEANSDPSATNLKTEPSLYRGLAGGNGAVHSSREREARNYDISWQELNICSEASNNIIQERGDSAVICYPCVPSGREEERQRICSYHDSAFYLTQHV